ncbi:DUF427 domain-containing protein [Microbacterium sp. MYb66]|jgi:uncharacterized protein (DUF427 family)|uniref:DUF427 domain-containing protein n=1 Tax=Microbacterium sp. MYb66 TaxID=1848692 RepID=UPI000D0026F5|nr:DUF427 domain-containing protein [Microbacterium sp. MYb66]PRA80441.1 hypothetical protein CQ045_12585 [Microbacterium sp. MYb66]
MTNTAVLDAPGIATNGLVHLERHEGRVEVWSGAERIASSTRVIELHEVDVPVRLYFPREDVALARLRPIDGTTFCPFKGVASDYWALGSSADDAPVAWSYPEPISAFAPIGGHIAFYDALDIRPVAERA